MYSKSEIGPLGRMPKKGSISSSGFSTKNSRVRQLMPPIPPMVESPDVHKIGMAWRGPDIDKCKVEFASFGLETCVPNPLHSNQFGEGIV